MSQAQQVKQVVKDSYGEIAKNSNCCCHSCGCGKNDRIQRQTQQIGYTDTEMNQVPVGSNLGLGCGNPTAIASLKSGEVVLDLGSGAGFDAFLAANQVGKEGKVIGVDMTPQMLEKADGLAAKNGYTNVEFREGDIEALPVKDEEIDVVISNCVINLAPDKSRVFNEIYRVLKPGGRLMVSDTMLLKPLPEEMKNDPDLLTGCVSGALLKDDYLNLLNQTGFKKIQIHEEKPGFLEGYSLSVTYSAQK